MTINAISSATSQYSNGIGAAMGSMRRPGKMDLSTMVGNFIKAADSDGNGSLGASELSQLGLSQSAITALDTNSDGSLDSGEIKAAAQKQMDAMQQAFQSNSADSVRSQLDALKDTPEGQLMSLMRPKGGHQGHHGGANSISGIVSNFVKSADTDGNGALSGSEVSSMGISQDAFKALDTNGDGSLSTDEITAAAKKQMDAVRSAFQAGGPDSARQKIEELKNTPEGQLLAAMRPKRPEQPATEAYQQDSSASLDLLQAGQAATPVQGGLSSLNLSV